MTAIVGVYCTDGVVLGADSSATFAGAGGLKTIEQPTKKLHVIRGKVILASTGQQGLGQRFANLIDEAFSGNTMNDLSALEIAKNLCSRGIKDFASTQAPKGQYGALVAYPAKGKAALCEFALEDFQPELKNENIWFCSMGNGQLIADPFLAFLRDVFWNGKVPSVQDAVFAVYWALSHVISVNTGGINGPICVATLCHPEGGKLKATEISQPDMEMHAQMLDAAKEHFREFPQKLKESAAQEAGAVPKAT